MPGADLCGPRIGMDSEFSPVDHRSDYDFAFNDSNFSDRVLKIEIVADLPDAKPVGDGCSSIIEWSRNRKRRREDINKDKGQYFVFLFVLFYVNLNNCDLFGLMLFGKQHCTSCRILV